MKLLILEESPLTRTFIKEEFKTTGFELLEAGTPEEALETLRTVEGISLITLRVVMKGMDGFQFLEYLQTPEIQAQLKAVGNHRAPAVFVTSNDTDKDRLRGFKVGAADFIQKPWPPGELLKHVSHVLGRSTELAGMSLLVVDDSRTVRSFIRSCLQRLGVRIHEAGDGEEAVEFLRKDPQRVDLVITDLKMVRMDGDELVSTIRGELNLPDLPVIFLSGNEDKTKVLTLFKLGATDYLKKPFLQEELVVRIRAYLTRVKAQNKIIENMAELRDMNVVKDQFLAACSHDLRSPLTGILGFAQLLEEDGDLVPDDLAKVQGIRRSGDYLLSLINNLLDIGKMAGGHHELHRTSQDVGAIVQDSIRTLSHTAQPKQVTLNYSGGTDECQVMGDYSCLMRVCNNLISNAIKFTPEGGTVTVSLRDGRDDDLVLAVTDTGIGIPPEKIPELFNRYTRVHQSGTAGENGTGLGLSIVWELVKAHDGTVSVDSKVGEGSTFRIQLPKQKKGSAQNEPTSPGEAEPEIQLVMPGSEPETGKTAPEEQLTILYVDDSQTNRVVGQKLLEKMGYNVTLATDGQDGLNKFQQSCQGRRFDLVMMDMMMPGIDGLEATRLLRKFEQDLPDDHISRSQPVPVLAVTANDPNLRLGDCLGAGMNDFLTKPFVTRQLAEALERWILVPV